MLQPSRLRTWATRFALVALLGAGTIAEARPQKSAARKRAEIPLETVAERIDGVLKTGLNTIGTDALATLLMNDDPADDPFLLDIRQKRDFLAGHIPGAVNVPIYKFAKTWARKPGLIPEGRNVVVVGYYGGDGNLASLVINAVRIEDPADAASYPWSKTLFMGMMSWSYEPALSNGRRFDSDLGTVRVERATEATPNVGGAFGAPKVKTLRSKTLRAAILKLAHVALRKQKRPDDLQITPKFIADALDGGATDLQILSVRGGPHYALGHIPGAMNIGWKDVALADNRALIDPTKRVYVYCYTGHTGTLAAMALRLFGYDAVNVLYGINGWTATGAVASGQLQKFDLVRGWDFPVDVRKAEQLGSMDAWTPPTGCVACHTSLTGIFYDRSIENPPVELPPPPSVGEG